MTDEAAELELLETVLAWRDRPPAADIRGMPAVAVPTLGGLRKLFPESGAQKLLALSYVAALRLAPPKKMLAAEGVASVDDLRSRPVLDAQTRARRLMRRDMAVAAGTGTAFGFAGAAGMVADAPTLVVLGLRSLIRVGYCYGEQPSPSLAAAIFALTSADTVEEKRLAWRAAVMTQARAVNADKLDDAAVRDGLERAAEREFAKQALSGSLQKLGLAMTQRLGWRKAAGALPLVGAAVGGAVNARFIAQIADAAIQACNARRLAAAGYSVLPETAVAKKAAPKRKPVAEPVAKAKKVRSVARAKRSS